MNEQALPVPIGKSAGFERIKSAQQSGWIGYAQGTISRGRNGALSMQRVTITLDDDLMAELDRMIEEHGYQNRSEAIRDFARAGMQQAAQDAGKSGGDCVAALVYVYDHAARDLSSRLVNNFHDHHDLSLATLHVHLDNDNCMEITALKGRTADVQHLADHVIAERGVRYGRVVMIPTEAGAKTSGARKKHVHRHT
ncbi:MAG: CopG family nickel-responsive transcriptional regulator [Afipia broomeae]